MTTNTTPRATCEHDDSAAVAVVPCGQPQEWVCETWGGCGQFFTIVKPHHVFKFTTHAPACERKHLPAGWCGCEVVRTAGCVDCDREFPRDTVTDTDGPDPVIMFD